MVHRWSGREKNWVEPNGDLCCTTAADTRLADLNSSYFAALRIGGFQGIRMAVVRVLGTNAPDEEIITRMKTRELFSLQRVIRKTKKGTKAGH